MQRKERGITMKELDTSPIKNSVRLLYEAKKEKDRVLKHYEEVKKKEQVVISNFMFTHLPKNIGTFDIVLDEGMTYYSNHVKLTVTRVRTKKILWNIKKLKKALSKKIYNQCVDKTYTINNMKGLVEYLKECGVDAREFKKYITVSETVNNQKMDDLSALGEIKASDIEDCYELKIGEPYIRLTERTEQ